MAKRSQPINKRSETRLFRNRLLICALFVLVLAAILASRLWYLQSYQHERYTTLSRENQLSLLPIAPNRGLIYDRKGVLLADNRAIRSLEIYPDRVKDVPAMIKALQAIVPIHEEDIERFNKLRRQVRRFDSVPIIQNLSEAEMARFVVDQHRFPGVAVKSQLVRYYPFGKDFVHALGYVGRINEQEIEQVDKSNYSATNYIGKVGLEKFYEDQLHGQVGYQEVEVDASGRIVRVLERTAPIPGDNLYLSLDSELQLLAEAAMEDYTGSVVALDPASGQVLAFVSQPGYDPNAFVQGISSRDYQTLSTDEQRPLYNRAVRGQYPYGSTIKPFLALGALVYDVVSPSYRVFDPGYFKLNNHTFRCWKKTGHGWTNMRKAIKESCDTYFYTVALQMGITHMHEFLSEFGFGAYTGIDIKEELPGLLPSPAWKRRARGEVWYQGDTVNASIGQGTMLATPLQLATATAGLANRGPIYQPRLLHKMEAFDGTVTTLEPVLLHDVQATLKQWAVVTEAMQSVTSEPGGTAYRAYGKAVDYTSAGKTGTSQVFSSKRFKHLDRRKDIDRRLRDHSLFIAFAPYDKPQIALVVLTEHDPGKAPYVARKIMDKYFELQKNSPEAATEAESNEDLA